MSNDQVIEEGGILLPNFVLLVHKPARNDVEMSDQKLIRSCVFKLSIVFGRTFLLHHQESPLH